jgi:hypothetical protein
MKQIDAVTICPYTGLRSFTEEESLYFKGRDLQVDQITALLEQNKFLMVTGASGEGKSSLIYAGLIPNARAGFFKAKYSNWVVAGFRPERSPVKNMAASLASQFHANVSTIETELRRGYSSLVDLYINSEYYTGDDTGDTTEHEIRERKRKGANLIILVDQFEEFFTNPENFYNEVASNDSQVVVNLILETARIAIQKNLPVYILCTMRSDYIGQCSAFRGLPEYIGFSQFFVPRLKRKDLKQVIEEPAILSGNRISQRLIERLVFDLSEGVDQLPILQHALSNIWAAAENGQEEMDLIHYAMAGGMPVDELPDEDVGRFMEWFDRLPQVHRSFYRETGLHKIIQIHANLLYETAWDNFKKHNADSKISKQEAKRIIALSFSCLTKIDNSRAVRNRMSLAEITAIINSPQINFTVVDSVLSIFREEKNSFVRPFKSGDPATQRLPPSAILDITHESLIRNWNKLNEWANREYEFYNTFLDFQKQLSRWKSNGKARGYLLPAGTLTYFETWYNKCKPNVGWIMRYAESREDTSLAEAHAKETLNDTREFLKRSARAEMITRAFMKYGPQRIGTVFAILVMLVLSGFYWYNADQKKNARVITRVKKESLDLVNSNYVDPGDKAVYLLAQERYDTGSLLPYLHSLEFRNGVNLANEVFKTMLYADKQHESGLKSAVYSLLTKNLIEGSSDPEFLLTQLNKFLILLLLDQYYIPNDHKLATIHTIAEKDYSIAKQFFSNGKMFRPGISTELNLAVQLWLTAGNAKAEQVQQLLDLISPFSGKSSESMFFNYYQKGSLEPDGRMLMDFNGGYHMIACLYAAQGNASQVFNCFDKIIQFQRSYFELPRTLNNHLNVLGYLYEYGHRSLVPSFLTWMNTHTTDNPPVTVLRNIVIRSGYISHFYHINIDRNYYRSIRGYLYPNLCLMPREVYDSLNEDYDKVVMSNPRVDERQFTLAMSLKRRAIFYSKYWYDRQLPSDERKLDSLLDRAVNIYRQIDKRYLQENDTITTIYNGDGIRTRVVKRNDLFIYPDYRDGWFAWTYHTDYFFNYLQKKGLLPSLYLSGHDLQNLHLWIAKAYETKTDVAPQRYSKAYPLPDSILNRILSFAGNQPAGNEFDRNLFYLVLANHAFEKGDSVDAMKYTGAIDLKSLNHSAEQYEYLEKIFIINMTKNLCVNLAKSGKGNEAIRLAEIFPDNIITVLNYLYMAEQLYQQNADPSSFRYLDSAYHYTRRIDFTNIQPEVDTRFSQIGLLSRIGSKSLNDEAASVLREVAEDRKFTAIIARISGIAAEGNYYRALTSIPANLTETQDLECRTMILLEACKSKEKLGGDSRWNSFDDVISWGSSLKYVNYIPN